MTTEVELPKLGNSPLSVPARTKIFNQDADHYSHTLDSERLILLQSPLRSLTKPHDPPCIHDVLASWLQTRAIGVRKLIIPIITLCAQHFYTDLSTIHANTTLGQRSSQEQRRRSYIVSQFSSILLPNVEQSKDCTGVNRPKLRS